MEKIKKVKILFTTTRAQGCEKIVDEKDVLAEIEMLRSRPDVKPETVWWWWQKTNFVG